MIRKYQHLEVYIWTKIWTLLKKLKEYLMKTQQKILLKIQCSAAFI